MSSTYSRSSSLFRDILLVYIKGDIESHGLSISLHRCKEFANPSFLSVPLPFDFNGVKCDLDEIIDACTAYITTDMNGYLDIS